MKVTSLLVPAPSRSRRFAPMVSVLLAAMFLATSATVHAADEAPAAQPLAVPLAPAAPPPANPALAVGTPSQPEEPSIFRRWWFWTAVGAAVAATVVVVVVSSRGQAPPSTDLGNQEFQP